MLSNKDKQWIENTLKDIVRDTLTVEVTYEKHRDDKTGKPLATPELIKNKEYLPAWWIQYLPHYEASNRGIQETQDKQAIKMAELTNEINDMKQGMKVVSNILLQTENSLKCLAALSDKIKQEDMVKIESDNL